MHDFKLKMFDLKYLWIENILCYKDAKFEFNSIEIANVEHKKFYVMGTFKINQYCVAAIYFQLN